MGAAVLLGQPVVVVVVVVALVEILSASAKTSDGFVSVQHSFGIVSEQQDYEL